MSTIHCPEGQGCQVVCDAAKNQTCQMTTVDCSATGPCELQCGAGSQACQQARVFCGGNACQASCGGPDEPALVCGSSCACQGC